MTELEDCFLEINADAPAIDWISQTFAAAEGGVEGEAAAERRDIVIYQLDFNRKSIRELHLGDVYWRWFAMSDLDGASKERVILRLALVPETSVLKKALVPSRAPSAATRSTS